MQHDIESWVVEFLAKTRRTGSDGIVDISQVAPHPSRELAACTLTIRDEPDDSERQRVALVDLGTGTHNFVDLDGTSHAASWSPDGQLLCVLNTDQTWETRALVLDADGEQVIHTITLPTSTVESAHWSPDGEHLALVVAETGASISDVYGSGRIGEQTESWRPTISPSTAGRRRLVIWSLATSETRSLTELNVWEAGWLGPDQLVAITSEGPGEGDWYAAQLTLVGLDGKTETLFEPTLQLALPSGSPDGIRWSVLHGLASDRGLLAGDLVVSTELDQQPVETHGVHVTDYAWEDDTFLTFTGMRGLSTPVGRWNATSGTSDITTVIDGTTGVHQPALSGRRHHGALLRVLEQHHRPPTLGIQADGEFIPVLSAEGPGTDHLIARTGATEEITWTSRDGTEVQGLLTTPDTDGPHALIVNIHGGPVAAWHDGWLGRDVHTSLLVARGYAVLRPNPRGSTGRGAAYAEAVVGDMAGADVDDVLTGVEELINRGLVEAHRLGVTGNSYGGFLASWIPGVSDLFAASVARSPVTDWKTQHLTSNLAEFDQMLLTGNPFDPDSQYVSRSPLTRFEHISTPILFTAGAHDLATPASQAQVLHNALLERGVPTALAIYPEEGHGVRAPAALADQCARMIDWFDRYLGAPIAPRSGV